MSGILSTAKNFLKSENGPTAAEYAVMLALVIMVALGAIAGIGITVESVFTNADNALPNGAAS